MLTIFSHTFSRLRGQILGWGIGLAVFGYYLTQFYSTLAGPETRQQIEALISTYPPELFAMFGGTIDLFSPSGYLHLEFFSYMPLILGIFAVLAGSGLFAADEENGTLDLVLAHPISRMALFVGRALALLVALLAILALTWLGFLLAMPGSGLGLTAWETALPMLSLFALLFFVAALGVLLSMILPSRRAAAMTTGLILVSSYFLTSMASIDENLEAAADFSPLSYYQGGHAIEAMEWGWMAGLLGLGLGLVLLSAWLFQRRDIRIGGEGGWRLDALRGAAKATGAGKGAGTSKAAGTG